MWNHKPGWFRTDHVWELTCWRDHIQLLCTTLGVVSAHFQLSWESARMNPRCRLLGLFYIRAPSSMQLELAIIYPPTLTTVLLAQRKQPYPVCASCCRGFRCPFRGIWGPTYVLCRCEKSRILCWGVNPFIWPILVPSPGCTPTPGSPSELGSLAFLFPLSQWLDLFWRSHFIHV